MNEIILWNLGEHGQYIAAVLAQYFACRNITEYLFYFSESAFPDIHKDKNYFLFYLSDNHAQVLAFRKQREIAKRNITFVSLCNTYSEGIRSMDKGDSYALCFPLEQSKIIQCYEHFNPILPIPANLGNNSNSMKSNRRKHKL